VLSRTRRPRPTKPAATTKRRAARATERPRAQRHLSRLVDSDRGAVFTFDGRSFMPSTRPRCWLLDQHKSRHNLRRPTAGHFRANRAPTRRRARCYASRSARPRRGKQITRNHISLRPRSDIKRANEGLNRQTPDLIRKPPPASVRFVSHALWRPLPASSRRCERLGIPAQGWDIDPQDCGS